MPLVSAHSLTDTLKKGAAPAVSAVYNLETSQHKKNGETCYTQGQEYLVSFSYDGSVHYTYQAGDITLKKYLHWSGTKWQYQDGFPGSGRVNCRSGKYENENLPGGWMRCVHGN